MSKLSTVHKCNFDISMLLTRKVLNLLIQVEVEKSRVSRRPSATWEEDSEIKTLEYVFSDVFAKKTLFDIDNDAEIYIC